MLTRRHLAWSALLAALALWPASGPRAQGAPPAPERLPVVASFSILGDLVREVGGDRVALKVLVGPNGDAHVYTPTPADARALTEARLVFVNGLKFEGWMDRLVKSSGAKAALVTASKGVRTVTSERPQDKGRHAKDSHGHDHRGAADPHAWHSIANAKVYVTNIRDALAEADPAGRPAYEANARDYTARLDALEAKVRTALGRLPPDRRRIVTSHDAFGYLADAYGLAFVAPRGVSTEAEATARDVARLITQIRRERIVAVFLENVTDSRLIGQIARETGARIGGTLYSDALTEPGEPAPTYIAMMRHNITELTRALGPAS